MPLICQQEWGISGPANPTMLPTPGEISTKITAVSSIMLTKAEY